MSVLFATLHSVLKPVAHLGGLCEASRAPDFSPVPLSSTAEVQPSVYMSQFRV